MSRRQVFQGGMLGGLAFLAVGAIGCQQEPMNRITIETFADPLIPRTYATDFDEAYFGQRSGGNVDVVLRWKQPSSVDPTQELEQIVEISAIWKPKLGTTRAEETMINALLRFAILTPPTGVCYEGSGFVTLDISRDGATVTGKIESGDLAPMRVVGGANEPFGPARITGRFRAVQSERSVVRLQQHLARELGL